MSPFTHHKRGSMTPHRVARIFAENSGKCHKCKRKMGPSDDYDIEHIVALENGGTDDDANLAPCCEWCHQKKTADDHSSHAKGVRAFVNYAVPKRLRKKRGWGWK